MLISHKSNVHSYPLPISAVVFALCCAVLCFAKIVQESQLEMVHSFAYATDMSNGGFISQLAIHCRAAL